MQGFYFSKPVPFDQLYKNIDDTEKTDESAYYNEIGKVNYLSPNPFEDYKDSDKLYNVTPSAIVQYCNGDFKYLYTNEGFVECLISMGIPTIERSEQEINDSTLKLKNRLVSVAKKSHQTQQPESIDFLQNGNQINIRIKEIADNGEMQAFYVVMFNLSAIENEQRIDKLETALNFLYTIYDRVDLIDVTNSNIENVYLSSHYYQTIFKGKNLQQSLEDYANTDISKEDRKKFLDMYEISTLSERIRKSDKGYISQPIRTLTMADGVRLQLYTIISVQKAGVEQYISCVRDIQTYRNSALSKKLIYEQPRSAQWNELISKELKIAVFEWNLKTGDSHVSEQAYQYMFCRESLDDIVKNKASLELVYHDDIPQLMKFFEESKSGADRSEVILRMKMIDGSFRWVRMIGLFKYDKDHELEYVMGVIVDVEDSHQNIEMMRLFNQMPIAMGVFEVEGGKTRQLFMNDEYFTLCEDTREKRMEKHRDFMNGIHPEDRNIVRDAMEQVIVNGSDSCSAVCRIMLGTGGYKKIRFRSSVGRRDQNHMLVYSTYVALE